MFFLDFFCGGIVSCFSAETRWAPMLGGIRKSGWDPRTQAKVQCARSSRIMMQEETENLLKDCFNLKSCVPFTCALTPPFTGRRRDFYIPKIPLNSKNIPSVNTYTNVFYTLYIYKLATSSHAKPGLFETASLTLLPTGSWISPFR
jgi:hypothetical protein